MSLTSGILETANRGVSVDLRCRKALMTKKLLDASQISSSVKKLGCKRMPHGMWRNARLDSNGPSPSFEYGTK